MKAVILDGYTTNPGDLSWDWLKEKCKLTIYDRTPFDETAERCKGYDIIITNKTPLSKEILEQLPDCKFIALLSTGYNIIDCEYAASRGIPVSNIPAYSTDGVAQLVFALFLEIVNHVALHNQSVKDGDWCRSEHFCYWKAPITELANKTLGIVGFGKIGSAVARIANAFGMNVIAYSPNTRTYNDFGKVEFVSLDEVTEKSDIISLHCPLTASTEGLVNMEFLSKMKKTAILINTSRGPVINEADLKKALDEGVIAAAGVDVLSAEPAKEDNPLLTCDNCIITPHIAWASFEARSRLMNIFKSNVEGFMAGKLINVVN